MKNIMFLLLLCMLTTSINAINDQELIKASKNCHLKTIESLTNEDVDELTGHGVYRAICDAYSDQVSQILVRTLINIWSNDHEKRN